MEDVKEDEGATRRDYTFEILQVPSRHRMRRKVGLSNTRPERSAAWTVQNAVNKSQ